MPLNLSLNSQIYQWKLKWLWLRHSYSFRWAHKPLCQRFSEDVLTVGHVHLCRSCTFLWLGGFIGLLGCLLVPPLRNDILWISPLSLFATLLLSAPGVYKKWPRWVRDGLRFSLGAALPLWLCLMLMGYYLLGAATVVVGLGVWFLYSQNRKKRKMQACESCPEYGQPQVCSGCTLQASQIRLYETKATQLYLESGQSPFG
ncbi:MAG: hypothetical protein AAF702_36185 [Chloroflexota bacterium]